MTAERADGVGRAEIADALGTSLDRAGTLEAAVQRWQTSLARATDPGQQDDTT